MLGTCARREPLTAREWSMGELKDPFTRCRDVFTAHTRDEGPMMHADVLIRRRKRQQLGMHHYERAAEPCQCAGLRHARPSLGMTWFTCVVARSMQGLVRATDAAYIGHVGKQLHMRVFWGLQRAQKRAD